MRLFDVLGFCWDRSAVPAVVPIHSVHRATFRFHRMLPEFVWDASVLEGNPLTFVEVQTILDGVTVGGRKISDQEQVINLAESSRRLLSLVKAGKFELSKSVFVELHGIVARNEALECGVFRGEGEERNFTPDVVLGEHGRYTPLATAPGAPELNRVFREGSGKQMGNMFMWLGIPFLIIPPAGILLLAIGYFFRRQGVKKIDLIRAGTEAYCKSINIEYQPAPL